MSFYVSLDLPTYTEPLQLKLALVDKQGHVQILVRWIRVLPRDHIFVYNCFPCFFFSNDVLFECLMKLRPDLVLWNLTRTCHSFHWTVFMLCLLIGDLRWKNSL